ncbi:MAG TPA: HAD-IA family hydrolase [Longimicrobiales bacterium]|nr:HAD-IA family hydrolase [Longimicrobiales bacterium]
MTWHAVLFDLDGTLADTVPLILASARHAMAEIRGEAELGEAWREHIGRPLSDTIRDFARDEEEGERLRASYSAFQSEAHDRMVRPFPGALEVVEELDRRGIPLGIVTSKGRAMTVRTLAVCGLANAFRVVVTADEVQRGKPDPEPVHRALAALGMPAAEEIAFVGDSPHDIEAGRGAGIFTVGVTWGAFPRDRVVAARPDRMIETMGELLELGPGGR